MSKDKIKEVYQLLKDLSAEKEIDQAQVKKLVAYLEKELKPIKTRSAKNKGKGFQNLMCSIIGERLDIPWGTNEDYLIQSRQMGQKGVDVILLSEARERFPYSIECKNTENFSLVSTVKQAKDNIKEGTDWLIFYKSKKLKEPVAIMDARKAVDALSKD